VRSWVHTHRFRSTGPSSSVVEDTVVFEAPFGPLGRFVVRRHLSPMFDFRHRRTHVDLVRQSPFAGEPSMRIAVTGSSGTIGRELVPFLTTAGHRVERLVRRQATGAGEISWDPPHGWIDTERLEGVDAVVHLAGESIKPPWTRARRHRIRESRTDGTRLLCAALARLRTPPRVLVSASGVNFYGDRGDMVVDESGPMGTGFWATLCRDWEGATAPAARAGIRVVNMRNGAVLSARGGTLGRTVLLPFRLGVGGPVGDGGQYVSWIAIDDLLGAIYEAIHDARLSGPVNAAAPAAVTNRELTATLGRVLRRPAVLPAPAVAVSRLLGDVGRELLLTSIRAVPGALEKVGFRFDFPTLEDAVRFQLGRP
jgi:uncharacterized protein (TIGR01777 family)